MLLLLVLFHANDNIIRITRKHNIVTQLFGNNKCSSKIYCCISDIRRYLQFEFRLVRTCASQFIFRQLILGNHIKYEKVFHRIRVFATDSVYSSIKYTSKCNNFKLLFIVLWPMTYYIIIKNIFQILGNKFTANILFKTFMA